ncbi:MAG: hypothetical protein WC528_02235 [Patescibacteria group bacterium]
MKKPRGQILVIAALFLSVIVLLVAVLVSLILGNNYAIQKRYQQKIAFDLAEAGLDSALQRLNINPANGTETVTLEKGDFVTTISGSNNLKQVESIGYYPNATNPTTTKIVRTQVELNTDSISFRYGVQVGVGGMLMNNNSMVNGSIYSDGSIVGSSGAKITGDAYVATGMTLDHTWSVYKSDRIFAKSGTDIIDVAQSFRPTKTGKLSQISFYIKKIGNPSNQTIKIVTDNGSGTPTKTELASTTLYADRIGENYAWVNYSFPSPADLTANTWYWAIIDSTDSPSKYFSIGNDTEEGNGNGVSLYTTDCNETNPIWNEADGDFNFKIWMGGLPTTLSDVIVKNHAHANTITNTQICGDAYYQSIDNASLNFLNNPLNPPCDPLTNGTAYPDSEDPPFEALPVSDGNILDWRQDATAGTTYSDAAHCAPNADISLGPGILDCDFTPSNNITVTLTGTLWVTGNITLPENCILVLDSAYGPSSGLLMADSINFPSTYGKITVQNNVKICGSAGFDYVANECNPVDPDANPPDPHYGSYILILSTHSSETTNAISISNNSDGAIFYAGNGSAYISQNASLKEVTAKKLILENNAAVNYETGLANAIFSSGPGASWTIKKGTWQEL